MCDNFWLGASTESVRFEWCGQTGSTRIHGTTQFKFIALSNANRPDQPVSMGQLSLSLLGMTYVKKPWLTRPGCSWFGLDQDARGLARTVHLSSSIGPVTWGVICMPHELTLGHSLKWKRKIFPRAFVTCGEMCMVIFGWLVFAPYFLLFNCPYDDIPVLQFVSCFYG